MQQINYALVDMEFRTDTLGKTQRAWQQFNHALRQLHSALESDIRDLGDEITPIEGFRLIEALAEDVAIAARIWPHA